MNSYIRSLAGQVCSKSSARNSITKRHGPKSDSTSETAKTHSPEKTNVQSFATPTTLKSSKNAAAPAAVVRSEAGCEGAVHSAVIAWTADCKAHHRGVVLSSATAATKQDRGAEQRGILRYSLFPLLPSFLLRVLHQL